MKVLDAPWQVYPDPADKGRGEGWHLPGGMPASHMAATATCSDGHPVWGFLSFEALSPAPYAELVFDCLPDGAEVWTNGVRLGSGAGGPAAFVVAPHLSPELNSLAVRLPQHCSEASRLLTGSIGVSLDCRPQAHIEEVFVQPDIRRKRLTVIVQANAAGSVHLAIEGTPFATSVDGTGEGPLRTLLDFPEFECWEPRRPISYTLRVTLSDAAGEEMDRITTRFGMREFTVKERRFALNSRPCVLRGAHLQLDMPADALTERLEQLKSVGFNAVRIHAPALPEAVLTRCDHLGLLVWFDAVAPLLPGAVEAAVARGRNHPSLVMITLPVEHNQAEAVASFRALDPSRLLLLPRAEQQATGLYVRPYHEALEPCDRIRAFAPGLSDRAIEQHLEHNAATDRLVIVAEFGVDPAAFQGDGLAAAYRARGRGAGFGSAEHFAEALQEAQAQAISAQLDAVRSNARVAGYFLHVPFELSASRAASDVGADAGSLPSILQALRYALVPLRLVIECERTNIHPREETRVRVRLVNDQRVEGRADLSVQVVGPTRQVLWKKRRAVRITKGGDELWTGNLAASGSAGEHRIVARLLQGMNRVAETAVPLVVQQPIAPVECSVGLPPDAPIARTVHRLARKPAGRPHVYLVPRMANTVRAYPGEFVATVLGEVAAGAAAIICSPPDDWNDLAAALPDGVGIATSRPVASSRAGVYHYARRHPAFDGLPGRTLLGPAYRYAAPLRAFEEAGEEDVAGCLDADRLLGFAEDSSASPWGTTVLVQRLGEGRLIFTHLRLLENLDKDAVSARLLANLMDYYGRRAMPAEDGPQIDPTVNRWFMREQPALRRWMVLGPFPNFGASGHDTAFPPEAGVDLDAVYPGWYSALAWRSWFTTPEDCYALDLGAVAAPGGVPYTEDDYGTVYAYAEFNCPQREAVHLSLPIQHDLKVWLNGRLYLDSRAVDGGGGDETTVAAMVRQGKNTLLVKASKGPGPLVVSCTIEAQDGRPLGIKWWR